MTSHLTECMELLEQGYEHMEKFRTLNNISPVQVRLYEDKHALPYIPTWAKYCGGHSPGIFGTCAYYRHRTIHIIPELCARRGRFGRFYSWPGYTVDRTPYGVLPHELAHHVSSPWAEDQGTIAMCILGSEPIEESISGYDADGWERFAEYFRLYVTNPTLFAAIRPATFARFVERWQPIETRYWRDVLKGAHRQIAAAENKIERASRKALRSNRLPGL